MEAPEYYEHTRMRDILQGDLAAVKAMSATLDAQRRLLRTVVALGSVYPALSGLESTAVKLAVVEIELQQEINRHTVALGELVSA